ncbi:MAG: mechanosensitive ion channel family protein [Reichenbachiella sp.]
MLKYYMLLLIVSTTFPSLCQTEDNLSSPYRSLSIFLENTMDDSFHPEKAAIVFNTTDAKSDNPVDLAKKLDQVLRGSGIIIELNIVPNHRDYYDSVRKTSNYSISKLYPKIALVKKDGKWQFQAEAINEINQAHAKLFRFSSNLILSDNVRETYLGRVVLGIQIWQWLGTFCFIILGLLVRLIISLFFKRLLVQYLSNFGKVQSVEELILPIARPISSLGTLILFAFFYPILELPTAFGYYLVLSLKSLIPLFGVIVLYRSVDIIEVLLLKLVKKTESTLDDQLVPLLKKIIRVLIVLLGGLVIMDSLDVPILPLLTGLSIGGLAFALAAQDTIKNFFGSLMIFVDKPFQIGDWISSGDIDGTVEEVGFRSTRVRTFRNSVVYVPNGKLADSVIDNHGLRQFRRFRMMIALKYDTPPLRIEAFVKGLKKILHRHPKTNKEKYEIHLNQMGSSSLDVLFYIFFEAPTWTDELKFRQEIIIEILKLGEKLSVHFAFPTQTVNIENLPGQQSLSPVYTLTKEDLDKRLNEFFAN